MKKEINFEFEGNKYKVDVERDGDNLTLTKDGKTYSVKILGGAKKAAPRRAPVAAPAAAPETAPVQPTAQPEAQPAPKTEQPTAPAGETYTIKAGDTLYSIARRYGTTVDEITRLNPGLKATELKIGTQIRIK